MRKSPKRPVEDSILLIKTGQSHTTTNNHLTSMPRRLHGFRTA
jgi:hypothetical protein